MRITNKTPWTIEALETTPQGVMTNEFGIVAPNSVGDLDIAIYIGEMGGGECRKPMDRPVTLLEDDGKNSDGKDTFVISLGTPVGIKAGDRGNQLWLCVMGE